MYYEKKGWYGLYHAVEVYFARFARDVSEASCAGLFWDEFDTALLLPFVSIFIQHRRLRPAKDEHGRDAHCVHARSVDMGVHKRPRIGCG